MTDVSGADLRDLRNDIQAIMTKVGAIEALLNTEHERCRYREEIARASNNTVRIKALEDGVSGLKVEFARFAVTGGLAGGGIAAVISGVAYAIGRGFKLW